MDTKDELNNAEKTLSKTEIISLIQRIEIKLKDNNNKIPPIKELELLLKSMPLHPVRFIKGTKLFRIRDTITSKQLMSEGLWFPNDEKKCKRGRFNCENTCMAYFADTPNTAKKETLNNESEHFHILESYLINPNLIFGYVPIIDNKISDIEKNIFNSNEKERYLKYLNNLDVDYREKTLIIVDYIGKKIIQKTKDYRFTNMLGILLFSGYKLDGLIYPSVKSNFSSCNIVFKPKVANKYIQRVRGYKQSLKHPCIGDLLTYKIKNK